MRAPSELLRSALAVCGLGLSGGTANAAAGGISYPKSRLWAERGPPTAAHLHRHVEMQPLPLAVPLSIFLPLRRARQGTLTPRLWPKPVLGAGLAALM